MKKVFVTKWAMTRGIEECQVLTESAEYYYCTYRGCSYQVRFHKNRQAFDTAAEAVANAKEQAARKIKAHKRAIARLSSMLDDLKAGLVGES